jgi:ribosomal protein L13
LRDGRLARLKIYTDDQHNHSAQKPKTISLKKGNK